MGLAIYEELYQTPFEIYLVFPFCEKVIKDYERAIILIGKYLNSTKNNHNNHNNLLNNLPNNHLPKTHLLKNHQNRTVFSRTTKISQKGLEKRAQNQESKRIKLSHENVISTSLKNPVQSNRSQRHRNKGKYTGYSY